MSAEPILAYAKLNARIMPLDRGERYEDPLIEVLAGNGYGEVTGGGTGQSENGEIAYCGIDINLLDVEKGVPFICDFLAERGAPKGSALEFERNGEKMEVSFGSLEGLAIYLNGTDLPDEVYRDNDVNDLISQLLDRVGDEGDLHSWWEGPHESALYLYGRSAAVIKDRGADVLAVHPLAQRCRVVDLT